MNTRLIESWENTARYDRKKMIPRIVHLGFGAFHRAHQAVYADILASEHDSTWGYCEINILGGESQIADLNNQENLWTVAEMSAGEWQTRVVGVATSALHLSVDGHKEVFSALCRPEVSIISLTVTEKGYCHLPATGLLNEEHPAIVSDLSQPEKPASVPGIIVAALARRKAEGLKAVTIMSCDNMPENGHVTRNVVTGYARLFDARLAEWIDQNVTFPSTMVDRIVPAVTEKTLRKITSLTGINDPAAVACEPFRQWVIEDNFLYGRPLWENAGAELVDNVLPWEEMKLRMLNGSHSFLAYLGYLGGYKHINDCMEDEGYKRAAFRLMVEEQAPTLSLSHVDFNRYARELIDRYCNPALEHRTWQIAMDGSQKLPQRMLDSVRWHLRNGSSFMLLALGIAGWMRYVGGKDDAGDPIDISDPLADDIRQVVMASNDGAERVKALLSLKSVFSDDLPRAPVFVHEVTEAYLSLCEKGARQVITRLTMQ